MAVTWDDEKTSGVKWDDEPSKPYNSPLDSFGRGMTMAPASAALDALLGQAEGKTFGERFRSAKAYYDKVNDRARRENPNAYAGGEIATNAMAMAAAPALGVVGAPMSAAARGAPTALRMVAGVGDAMATAGLLSQARTADKDVNTRGQAMQEALYSPYNLLGAAGPSFEAAPAASQYWRGAANRLRTRTMAPDSPEAQRVFKETFGSQEAAGEATRNVGGKDVARRQTAQERAQELNYLRDVASKEKGALTDRLTSEGVVVNPNEVARDVVGARDRMFGEPGSRAETHPQVGMSATELGPHATNADRIVAEVVESMASARRPVAITREARGAMAGPEGSRPLYAQSGETGPRGVQSRTILEEGRQTQTVPTPSTVASEGPPPMSWSSTHEIGGRRPYTPGKAEAPTPVGERLQTDLTRPNPGSEWGVAIDAAPPQIRLSSTERAKSAIDAAVNDAVARGYATSVPAEAIRQNPGLKFSKAQADALRRAGEKAVQTQSPQDFAEFMRLKEAQRRAETFRGPSDLEGDMAAAGGGSGRSSHLYPSKHGAMYWALENYVKGPTRYAATDMADAMSAFMKNGATEPQASALAAALINQLRAKKEGN
jgi:hypothetical protein